MMLISVIIQNIIILPCATRICNEMKWKTTAKIYVLHLNNT